MTKIEIFFKNIKQKRVAFIGVGVSNTPLIELFLQKGIEVTVCDKRSKETMGQPAINFANAGAKLQLGDNYLENIQADIIFRTPGFYFNHPKLIEYRNAGKIVTSEIEVFFDLCPCTTIAVTGSDGKTTTTTLIAEFLRRSGKTVHLGGNIGVSLLPIIEKVQPEDFAVVELSSFQLISMRQAADISVVTNISTNHLDIHGTMEEYIMAKKNVFMHQTAFGKTILNADNDITANFADEVRGNISYFSYKNAPKNGAYVDKKGDIYYCLNGKQEFLFNKNIIGIPGEHNVHNILAAIAAVYGVVTKDDIINVVNNFKGVEHRIEFVRELAGVKWYNDSKATTPTSVIACLKSFNKKITLIAGGYDKKIPFEPLAPIINEKVDLLILIGTTANKIEQAVKNYESYDSQKIKIIKSENLENAVRTAQQKTAPNGVVALSPACASFDSYSNFEERGDHFKTLVNSI